jgi:hypothetical protein
VSKFIEECRREWKRLRVPDPVANEMASDLAVDLSEAEAEGVSAEEVLGSGAFDPRAFAASWAAERGVIPPAPARERLPGRWLILAAIAALALITATGAALAFFASPSGQAVAIPRVAHPPAAARALGAQANVSGLDIHRIGVALLLVGLIGVILSVVFWLFWTGPGRWSRWRTDLDHGPSGAAG